MPSISVEGEVSDLAADPETVEILEQCVINWLNQISTALEGQMKKTPQVRCAMLLQIPNPVHGTADWFQIGNGVRQGCILSPCLFNLYSEYIMRNAGLEETQAAIKIARRNINNLR